MSTTVSMYGHTGKNIFDQYRVGALPPYDEKRGTYGILIVIATEACLFLSLFAAYYLLGNTEDRWQVNKPPGLGYGLALLAVLVASSIVLIYGEHLLKKERYRAARITMFITFLMGLGFLAMQAFEYLDHWKELTPDSNAYGSIFYTITTLHAAHVIVGLLLLGYVLLLPRYGPTTRLPHRPYAAVSLYWHFVDVVWVAVVILLYLIPHGIVYGF